MVGLDKPVLAAVNGIAAGVGCSTALAADVIIARSPPSFLLAFARIGLMPDGGASATVAAAIGRARAMRMGLLAEPLSAREAYDAGLITHLAPDEEFDDLVATHRPPPGRRRSAGPRRDQAGHQRRQPDQPRRRPRARAHRPDLLLRTDDVAEGMRAFSERRKPVLPRP